ncbi:MAG: HD domain-containing phosphohydrolase [Candidatus Methylumidiphilus sp.]
MENNPQDTLLVVDDSPEIIDVLGAMLRPRYQVKFATKGVDALAIAQHTPPSLILLDVKLLGIGGHEVCRRLKADPLTSDIPVIFITASSDSRLEQLGLELGAVDYLHKPLIPALVLQRVRIHLEFRRQGLDLQTQVQERDRQLQEAHRDTLLRLSVAAECRDSAIGLHHQRVSHIAHLLALAAGLPAPQAERLRLAGLVHDVGKIGIPDHILRKPSNYSQEEWALMQRHPQWGADIIGQHDSPLLRMSRTVALTHHEHWDGSGFPYGLAGESIPLEGRITAIADVFDNLISARPYKEAWPTQEAFALIHGQAGVQFDPRLVSLFLSLDPEAILGDGAYGETPD